MSLKKITVIRSGEKISFEAEEGRLLSAALSENGFTVPAACGGRGTCGKCAVRLKSGCFGGELPDENGKLRSCRAVICSDAVIEAEFEKGNGLTEFFTDRSPEKGACGIAVDIGTTTVAAALLLPDGSLKTASRLNPQSVYGADVISRIDACSRGALDDLARLIRGCIGELMSELSDAAVPELVITGNTTMLHLFCGVSPEKMGVSPFVPEFTDVLFFKGSDMGLNAEKITVLPSASAYIGSDIVAGIFALGLHKTDKNAFLADLGTNGELVFSKKGKLICASTAAGPALEGACIECGSGGIKGAINRVTGDENGVSYTTIGGGAPVGICGAGLTDALALMVRNGIIDETGWLEEGSFIIGDGIYISQNDIRQFQLAKSAIMSGIQILSKKAQVPLNETDVFYLAGGLGYYIQPESAVEAGLLPKLPTEKIIPAGNTGLCGAVLCIGNPAAVEKMREIASLCEVAELGGDPEFNTKFAENMFFE